MSEINNCEECIKRAKLLFEQYKRSAEEEYKYTSLVFSLGYAAVITIFSTIHTSISLNLKGIFISIFAISLISFVINEIWKMKLGQKYIENNNKIWNDFTNKFYELTSNLTSFSHAYMFAVDSIEESMPLVIDFVKKILCPSKHETKEERESKRLLNLKDEQKRYLWEFNK